MSCSKPRTTKKVVNPGSGPLAWCSGCQAWQPAEQVSWDRMLRNKAGTVTATYAPSVHAKTS